MFRVIYNSIKVRLHYLDKYLLFAMLFLLVLGIFEIQSAASVLDVYEGSINAMLYKQIAIVFIGLVVFFLVIIVPYQNYSWLSSILVVATLTLLVYVLMGETSYNSSKSWIDLGFFDLQPSEFGKLAFIMYLGAFYNYAQGKKFTNENSAILFQPVIVFGAFLILIIIQPDPGTALVYMIIFGAVMLLNGLKFKDNLRVFVVMLVGVFIILIGLIFVNIVSKGAVEDYFVRMISRFDYKDPCTQFIETKTKGYQVCNSMIAVNNGGIFGLGYNLSLQKHFYLPYAHTDSIIAIVSEELGFIGFSVVIFTYAFILYRGLSYARKVPDAFGSVIAGGVVALFASHIFINLYGNVGMIPLIGIPLPFLSYGGTFLITSCIAMGMLQAVAIRYNHAKKTGKLD